MCKHILTSMNQEQTLTPQEQAALVLFKKRVLQAFPGQVNSIQLFGSKARGEATKFSDVDVLVVLKDMQWQDRHTISNITADILLETDIVLSPKTFSQEQFEQMKQERSMFWQTIAPDLVSF